MNTKTVIQALHSALVARDNCIKTNNQEWKDRWTEYARRIEKDLLPSGSGIDCGTTIEKHSDNYVVLSTQFHHMDDNGSYDGWTQHLVIVRPSFDGLRVSIGGRNRNDIKNYLHEVYTSALSAPMPDEVKP